MTTNFWGTWFPPNGFMCRCSVQSLSATQVEARGLEVEDRVPGLVEPTDPATGNKLPAVPLVPDPGWGGNVGRDWLAGLAPRPLDSPIKDLATAAICKDGKGIFSQGALCKPPLASLDKRHLLPVSKADILPKGLKPEEYVAAFLKEFGLKDLDDSKVHTPLGGITVPISREFFLNKKTGLWKVKKCGQGRHVKLLAKTILNPFEVWHVPALVGNRPTDSLRAIRLFAGSNGEIGGYGVWTWAVHGWTESTVFTPNAKNHRELLHYCEKQRVGTLVFREP